MMFQGSQNLGKMVFVKLVQQNGGILNGSTRFDFTNYFEVLPANKLETAFLVVFAVVVSDLVLLVLKTGYFRQRPSHILNGVILPLGVDNESSFPSGHTTRAFAVASLVSLRMGRKYVLLLVLAIGVALSRIIIGVHFPLDVVGGAFLGILLGLVFYEYGPRVYRYVIPRLFPDRESP